MISVVIYGRNDNYGYNYHKRVAISINCIAEILTYDSDEIIFVDYNTPNDFPTLPESISDIITLKAKSKLRILRVRPEIHQARFKVKTNLKIMEHVARNLAVRKSNPINRWILSTNTDMIFVPLKSDSLSELVQNLPKGIYGLPRFEIPETIWESYQRMDPRSTILKTRELGQELHLNEVVKDNFQFDSPGDFQLIERQDLFDNYGFDERIMNGIHIDSNINKRLAIKYGSISDASSLLLGYHCNHTRLNTTHHKYNPKVEDEHMIFVRDIIESSADHQAKYWGLIGKEIEETYLNSSTEILFKNTIKKILKFPQKNFTYSNISHNDCFKNEFAPNHVLPYLLDKFIYMEKNIQIMWFGKADKLFDIFSEAMCSLDFVNKVKIYNAELNKDNLADIANFFIINLSDLKFRVENEIIHYILTILKSEKKRIQNNDNLRKIYIIDSINTKFEEIIKAIFVGDNNTYNSRILNGYFNTDLLSDFYNYTSEMIVGDNAVRKNSHIENTSHDGTLAYGPYKFLATGTYILYIETFNNLKFTKEKENFIDDIANKKYSINKNSFIRVEIVFDEEIFYIKEVNIPKEDLIAEIPFEITDNNFLKKIQFRVINFGFKGCLGSFKVMRV